jgi:hypothetical protein
LAAIHGDAHEQALYEYDGTGRRSRSDDVLDYAGDESLLGKPVGGDLRQHVTLPFFYYVQMHDDPARLAETLTLRWAKRQRDHGDCGVGAFRGTMLGEAQDFAEKARPTLRRCCQCLLAGARELSESSSPGTPRRPKPPPQDISSSRDDAARPFDLSIIIVS